MSNKRPVSAGSPQGSILGCFLYCITTQQLGSELVDIGNVVENDQPSAAVDDDVDGAAEVNETEEDGESDSDYDGPAQVYSTPLRTHPRRSHISRQNCLAKHRS